MSSSSSSFVWQHAKKIDKDRGQCNHCGKTYALGGGTSSLVLHLKNQHANILKKSDPFDGVQAKIEQHTRPCDPKRAAKLKSLISDLIIRDLRLVS